MGTGTTRASPISRTDRHREITCERRIGLVSFFGLFYLKAQRRSILSPRNFYTKLPLWIGIILQLFLFLCLRLPHPIARRKPEKQVISRNTRTPVEKRFTAFASIAHGICVAGRSGTISWVEHPKEGI